MESSRQKETDHAKKNPEKTFEGDFKKMELTWGTAEQEAKERHSVRKRSSCIILNGSKHSKKIFLEKRFYGFKKSCWNITMNTFWHFNVKKY